MGIEVFQTGTPVDPHRQLAAVQVRVQGIFCLFCPIKGNKVCFQLLQTHRLITGLNILGKVLIQLFLAESVAYIRHTDIQSGMEIPVQILIVVCPAFHY